MGESGTMPALRVWKEGDTLNSSPEDNRPQKCKPGATFSYPLPHFPVEPVGLVS